MKKFKLLTLIALATLGMGLAGCETINGAGQDVEKVGEAVQRAAH